MAVIFKETYLSHLSQDKIWDNLMLYSEFDKSFFDKNDKRKIFTIYAEGLKYNIYSEMKGYSILAFLRRINRINTDMHAELKLERAPDDFTLIHFQIIRSSNIAFKEAYRFFLIILFITLGFAIIVWGLMIQGIALIIACLLLPYIIFKQRKIRNQYKVDYVDLFNKIKA